MDTTSLSTNEATTAAETVAESSSVLEAEVEQVAPLMPETSPVDALEGVPLEDEIDSEDEIEDELIIEDFTIDGICGVY